jgi:hypothetical protein
MTKTRFDAQQLTLEWIAAHEAKATIHGSMGPTFVRAAQEALRGELPEIVERELPMFRKPLTLDERLALERELNQGPYQ